MDINITILFQLALFLIVLVLLSSLIIKPLMRIFEMRHKNIHGTRVEVDRLNRLATENQAAYLARIREAQRAAQQEREILRAQGNDQKRALLSSLRTELTQSLNATREEVALSELAAHRNISSETEQLARRLIAKVIGRELAP